MLRLALLRPELLRPELLRAELLRPELLRPVAFRVVDEPLLFRVDVLRDAAPLREELVVRDEVARRVLPVAVFAAVLAVFAAFSKSLRIALPNFVESRRASDRNLPKPL